ncbi:MULTISPECIES: nodulation methyltransferase NodS [Rhizobium]|uniref:Nodulation protein S n=2 Tax=Rhizobium tropici TaxID=398 RepID=E1AP42_RHITR|nr:MULTISPECIES: nodulation methyltransferase NodS [Rhizobium]ADN05135.1 methyltransferase [Rhizobium tropici]ADN05136.1 methyltransferase [Rhizobium tropici]ADN05137.1 methyltransferase [Rhizobium tropici]ADN05138.1 methyltransferase [Rhizobium tropici]ADN05139.1 methyltransferase [Rhizobium tropici]
MKLRFAGTILREMLPDRWHMTAFAPTSNDRSIKVDGLKTHDNYQLLNRELAADDPWRLDGNPFERKRHAQMLLLSLAQGPIANALEVGCAAGAFTEKLAPHCQRLTVIDVVPEAIDRTRRRMNKPAHISWVVSDVQQFSSEELFDLIVVAEVLYYLGDIAEMRMAGGNLLRMLAPGGHLVFGSARDANCQRWGHVTGAETVIAILTEMLVEVERLELQGDSDNEDCLLVRFRNPVSSS